MKEKELVKLTINGNEDAFKQIYELNSQKVINICYKFVQNIDIAEELTQEVFVKVFRSISRFKGDSKLSTWIHRIAVSKSLDYLRSQKTKKRFAFVVSLDNKNDIREIKSSYKNPQKKLEEKERKEILNKALEKLPEKQKIALILNTYKELSYKEIAEILNTTLSSVDSLISRGKKNLEKNLEKYIKKYI